VKTAIVIGAGIAGLSTAWALNRRGFAVTVIEQGPIPNPRGSSYDEHRITRYAYGPMEGYAAMMPAAFEMYDRLFADTGTDHFARSPVVYFMRDDDSWYLPSKRSLEAMGAGYREVPLGEIPERYPVIRTDGITRCIEAADGGMLFPIRILTDLVVTLGNKGVVFHPYSRVAEVDPEAGRLVANGAEHRADFIVVAAGAWVNKLTDLVADTVVPSRQAVMYLAPPVELAQLWAEVPVLIDLGTESGTYTLPPRRGTRLKIGDHVFTRSGDPDGDRIATEADLARLHRAARLSYRDFDSYQVLERKICFYTVTRDPSEQFAVKPWGTKAWVLSACSGHGFKLGPLMGDAVAASINGEMSPEDTVRLCAGMLSLDESRAVPEPNLAHTE
jgi:glycine/D-amino acid oxidase-like deaminating enzyme